MALFARLRRSFRFTLAQLRRAWAPDGVIVIPAIVASNAHVINLRTAQVYYSKGTTADEDRPASLTKLMTVLVLLDYKSDLLALSQTVTIQASDQVGGSGNNLLNGDVITLHALMMDALLPSSNSAATAIARTIGQEILNAETGGVGDPVARFVAAMNAKAVALGCVETTFFNASGLGAENTSTPAEINTIAAALWQSEIARVAWTYRTYSMPLVRAGVSTTVAITSSNEMFTDAGVVGGKTGTLTSIPPATYNLNVLWRAPNLDVVSLTIFASSSNDQRYMDMRALIAALTADYPDLGLVIEPLAAVGASVSTGAAGPTVNIDISALGLAVATGSASPEGAATITLSAAGLAQAAATAGLSAQILLAGAGAAQAAGDATLAAQLSVAAAGAAQAAGTATLTGSEAGQLAAGGSAQSLGSAALVLDVRLSASAVAQASGSAAIEGEVAGVDALAASGAAQAAGAAGVVAQVVLTGAGFVQAMGAGQLAVQVPLHAAGSASASGTATAVDAEALLLIYNPAFEVFTPGRRFEVSRR